MTRLALPYATTLPLRRLSLNSLRLLLARISAQAFSLVFVALLARRLRASGLGEYALVTSVVFLGNVVTTFGTDTLIIRELGRARRPDPSLVSTAISLQLGLSFLLIVAASVWEGGATPLSIYSLSLVPLAFYSVYSAVLRGFERMDLFLLLNLVASVAQLLCGLVAFVAGWGLAELLAALVVEQLFLAGAAWWLCRPYLGSAHLVRPSSPVLRATLYASLPFALLTTCAVIYQRMGLFALGAMAGPDAAGWFSAASRIVETFKIAPQALLGALLPMMADRTLQASIPRLYRASTALLVAACLATAIFLTFLSAPLVNAIYGEGFAPAVGALALLAWSLVPFAITSTASVRLVAEGREWLLLIGTVTAVSIALLLFHILISGYGMIGACWAAVIAETLQAGIFIGLGRLAR